jgi:hypothetical protein
MLPNELHVDGLNLNVVFSFPHGAVAPNRPGSPQYRGFTITPGHNTLGMSPVDE